MYKTTIFILTLFTALVVAQQSEPSAEQSVSPPGNPDKTIPAFEKELPAVARENIAAMKEHLAKVEEMLKDLPAAEARAKVEEMEAVAKAEKNRVIEQLPEEAREKVQEALSEVEKNINERRAEFEEELEVE